jgi:2-succinyl-5-enolpyruvyl-6-hydroxy-3-cyclohexene-1-carboxylate synthase
MTFSAATRWSLEFFTQLDDLGVRHVVMSPGSRSQALAFAAFELSVRDHSQIDVHIAIDERSAAFVALGLTINSGQPTVLVCTSGSAPAHYLPALMEAKHSGLPLIVVSADRPPRLHGVGANQTTHQEAMFVAAATSVTTVDLSNGSNTTSGIDTAHAAYRDDMLGASGGRSGPAHLNILIDEPLSSPITEADVEAALASVTGAEERPQPSEQSTLTMEPAPGTVVVAGHGAGPEAEELAVSLGAPLIAEVHSGAHMGPHLVVAYRELLDTPLTPIARVITVGRPTLSREVQALLERTDVEHVVWQRREPEASNPSRSAQVVDRVIVNTQASAEQVAQWVRPWVEASRDIFQRDAEALDPAGPDVALSSGSMKERAEFASKELAVYREPLTRRNIAQSVWNATWPHDFLYLGSSRMIRECDRVVPGKKLSVWSSRGLSGIDGALATVRGISIDRAREGATGVSRALLGDLTLLHDAGSLLMDAAEADSTWVQVIVVRDGGGSIFDLLEARNSVSEAAFDRVMFTPASADLSALASAYGWDYRHVTTLGELSEALMDKARHLIIDAGIAR